MVMEEEGLTLHPKAVTATVSWTVAVSEAEQIAGIEGIDKELEIRVSVQPELKLPTKGPKGLEWAQSDSVHPYWFIKRTEMDESEANADLRRQCNAIFGFKTKCNAIFFLFSDLRLDVMRFFVFSDLSWHEM